MLPAAMLLSALSPLSAEAQSISGEVRFSYLPAFSETYITTRDFSGLNVYSVAALINLEGQLPLSVGAGFAYGRRILLDIPASPNPPLGAGPTDMKQQIELKMIEFPVFYRIAILPGVETRVGLLAGIAWLTRMDHALGRDYSFTLSRGCISPHLDVGWTFWNAFRLAALVEYRNLRMSVVPAPGTRADSFDIEGVLFGGSLGYTI